MSEKGCVTNTLHHDPEEVGKRRKHADLEAGATDERKMIDNNAEGENCRPSSIRNLLHQVELNAKELQEAKEAKEAQHFESDESIRDSEFTPASNLKLAKFQGLQPCERAVRITSTVDALFMKNFSGTKESLFLALLEFVKIAIYIATSLANMESCAVFSPTVLLIGGAVIFAQIAIMLAKKLLRGLHLLKVLFQLESSSSLEELLIRFLAGVGVGLVELYFVVATFWYLNTLNNVIESISAGLTLLIVDNLDSFAMTYIKFECVVVVSSFNEKQQKWLDRAQLVAPIVLFAVMYFIAINVSFSDHSTYQTEYCD